MIVLNEHIPDTSVIADGGENNDFFAGSPIHRDPHAGDVVIDVAQKHIELVPVNVPGHVGVMKRICPQFGIRQAFMGKILNDSNSLIYIKVWPVAKLPRVVRWCEYIAISTADTRISFPDQPPRLLTEQPASPDGKYTRVSDAVQVEFWHFHLPVKYRFANICTCQYGAGLNVHRARDIGVRWRNSFDLLCNISLTTEQPSEFRAKLVGEPAEPRGLGQRGDGVTLEAAVLRCIHGYASEFCGLVSG